MVASYTGWYTTARYSIGRCTSHTPGPMFPCSIMLDISTSGIMPVPNTSASQTSSRDLSEEVSFGIGNPLGSRSLELSKTAPGVCGIHRRINLVHVTTDLQIPSRWSTRPSSHGLYRPRFSTAGGSSVCCWAVDFLISTAERQILLD